MKKEFQEAISRGRFGLEKESLRVDKYTHLPSVKDHPFGDDPFVSRDFCEAQTEIITPICYSTEELFTTLHSLNEHVKEVLSEYDELLWNHSNPPAGYDENAIRIAHFTGQDHVKEEYRRYLRTKYGISKMLMCGIHFNFSFADEALSVLSGFTETPGNRSDRSFRDDLFLKLGANAMKYAWLITYLTAASPVLHSEHTGHGNDLSRTDEDYASLRCSEHGYWNEFIPILDYTGLNAYIDSIQSLVDTGNLYSAWELYLPVRLKPTGENTLSNLRRGISHIELRMLDINPLAEDGILKEDIDFIHLLLMMWAVKEPFSFDAGAQRRAIRNMQQAALLDSTKIWIEDPEGIRLPVRDAALQFLAEMDRFYEAWEDPVIFSLIQYQRRKVLNSKARYAERVLIE